MPIGITGKYRPPESPELSFNVELPGSVELAFNARVPSAESDGVVLYHKYGKNTARYYDLTDEQQTRLAAYYNTLRGRIMPQGATGFKVHFLYQIASYRDENGRIVQVYLKDYNGDQAGNQEIEQSLRRAEILVSKEIYHGSVRSHAFRPDEKGSASGVRALTQGSRVTDEPESVLNSLPEDQRRVAEERIGRAQALIDERRGPLVDQIKRLDQQIGAIDEIFKEDRNEEFLATWKEARQLYSKTPQDDLSRRLLPLEEKRTELRAEKKRLDVLMAKWDQVDLYALFTALAHLPEDVTEEAVKEAARKVVRRILEENPSARNYAIDVGGLLFSALPEASPRVAYLAYCREMEIGMCQDCLEDDLIAAVMQGKRRGLLQEAPPQMERAASVAEVSAEEEYVIEEE